MRTSRLFLGIFALALLLPLLLLACGGSDEPADGLSSERATNEPESRASSGQTPPEPTTESAAPAPRATARPPLAQTSPETDREALVALYNATGGPDWLNSENWLSDVPIGKWNGVGTDDNGRVTGLGLSGNQLSGEIPPELGNLANLEDLALRRNQLSGEIPPELGNLANLRTLYLDGDQLSGEIPPELGNLVSLEYLELGGDQLSGEIPPELGNLASLKRYRCTSAGPS